MFYAEELADARLTGIGAAKVERHRVRGKAHDVGFQIVT